jgi:hypothetical protein
MEVRAPPKEELGYPYKGDVEELVEDLSLFETRARPRKTEELAEFNLDYGWKAILYRNEQNFLDKSMEKFWDFVAEGNYRTAPDYEWELQAPDGEVYRVMGIETVPGEFAGIIEDFRD